MMYDGTPLRTRYAGRAPTASAGAEIVARLILGSLYGLTIVALLAAYYVVGSVTG